MIIQLKLIQFFLVFIQFLFFFVFNIEHNGRSFDNTKTSFHRGSYSKLLSRSGCYSSIATLYCKKDYEMTLCLIDSVVWRCDKRECHCKIRNRFGNCFNNSLNLSSWYKKQLFSIPSIAINVSDKYVKTEMAPL